MARPFQPGVSVLSALLSIFAIALAASSAHGQAATTREAIQENREADLLALLNAAQPLPEGKEIRTHAIHLAVERDNIELIRALAAAGVDLESPSEVRSGYTSPAPMEVSRGTGSSMYDTPLMVASVTGKEAVVRVLLELGAKVDTAGMRETPLMKAAERGHLGVVEILIQAGAQLNLTNRTGKPAIELAADYGHFDVVRRLQVAGAAHRNIGALMLRNAASLGRSDDVRALLASGVPPDAQEEESSSTPLTRAANRGRLECARLLLEAGADPGGAGGRMTPLGSASWRGHADLVELLLQAGAPVNAKNAKGETALWLAASARHTEVVKVLQAAGADALSASDSGEDPLFLAAQAGDHVSVAALLAAGADGLAKRNGVTPLMAAASAGSAETIRRLLAAGADVNAKASGNRGGLFFTIRTPLEFAAAGGHYQAVKALRAAGAKGKVDIGRVLAVAAANGDLESVQALIADGADVDYKGSIWPGPPLMEASRNAHVEVARALVQAGADVNIKSHHPPLAWSAVRGSEEIVRLLIEAGADLDVKAWEDQQTPLIAAAEKGHVGVVRILLGAGADPAVRDKKGRTALDTAGSNAETIEVLRRSPGEPGSLPAEASTESVPKAAERTVVPANLDAIARLVEQLDAMAAGPQAFDPSDMLAAVKVFELIEPAVAEVAAWREANPDHRQGIVLAARLIVAKVALDLGRGNIPAVGDEIAETLAPHHEAIDRLIGNNDADAEAHHAKALMQGISLPRPGSNVPSFRAIDFDGALASARRAVAIAPDNGVFRATLIPLLLANDSVAEALEVLSAGGGSEGDPMARLLSDILDLNLPDQASYLRDLSEDFAFMLLERGRIWDSLDLRARVYFIPMTVTDLEAYYGELWPGFEFFSPEGVGERGSAVGTQFLRHVDAQWKPVRSLSEIPEDPSGGVALAVVPGEHVPADRRSKLPRAEGGAFTLLHITNFRDLETGSPGS